MILKEQTLEDAVLKAAKNQMYPEDHTAHAIAAIDSANLKDAGNVHRVPLDSVLHTVVGDVALSLAATKEHGINSSAQHMVVAKDVIIPIVTNLQSVEVNSVLVMEEASVVLCLAVRNLRNHQLCIV